MLALNGSVVLQGEWKHQIKADETVWSVEDAVMGFESMQQGSRFLTVELVKAERGVDWQLPLLTNNVKGPARKPEEARTDKKDWFTNYKSSTARGHSTRPVKPS